jgi:tetratricopeptide (TPR) repeat protein
MALHPKQGVGSAPPGAPRPPRTHEFIPFGETPGTVSLMAEVERLLARSGSTRDSAEAVMCLRRAAALLIDGEGVSRSADPERAFLILCMAFRRAPDDGEVVVALDRLAEGLGRWDELCAFADEVMMELDEPVVLGRVWSHVARWSRRAQRWDKALEAGESALALAPEDESAFRELEEIYRHLGHHGPLARLLARRARVLAGKGTAMSRPELLEIHLELAALYEGHLDDDEQAIAASERAFNLDPTNTAALTRLERLAGKHNRRTLLVDVLERRLACATSPADRSAVSLRLATAWEAVGRTDNACRVLGAILAEGIEDPAVLRGMARLYRMGDEPAFLAQTLERLLATTPGREEGRHLNRELAELYARALDRPEDAERILTALHAEDPTDVRTARLLAALWRKGHDWARLGDLLLRAGHHAQALDDRLAFLREAVRVHSGRLNDRVTARAALNAILQADPTDREALDELIADAVAAEDWEGLRSLASTALGNAAALPPERAGQLHDLLARAHDGLLDGAAALAHRREAAALCPDHPEYLRALADTLVDEGHLVEALPQLEWLWEHPEPADSDAYRADLAHRRARAFLAHGNRAAAREALQQAVQLAPAHAGALEALGTMAIEDGDTAAAVRYKEALLRAIDDGEAPRRVALATELARLYQHDLNDRKLALRVLKDGLALVPGSHQILHAQLDLQVAGRAWRGAVDTLLELAEGIDGPARGKYLATAARIAEDKLHAPDEAASLFGKALDADPTAFEIFARLERSLTERQAFAAQAHAYRSMLARVQDHDGPEVAIARRALWRGLGEIYRTRLRDPRSAIVALDAAAAMDPTDSECRLMVTELCEVAGPDTWGRAVVERRQLLAQAPTMDEMAPHLRSLYRLGLQINHLDQAFRASEALVALGLASPEEQVFHERQRELLPIMPPDRPLTEVRWHKLRHAEQDARLSLAFSAVGRAMLVARGRAARAWGLRDESPSERQENERSILAQMVAELTTMLGAPQPQLRFRPDLPGTVDLAGVVARTEVVPTLVAGADMLQVRSRREILALVAKTATRLRYEHLVLWPTVVPNPVELQVAILALRRLCGQPTLTPLRRMDARLVARYAENLRRVLTPQELEQIAAVAADLDPAGVAPWVRGAIFTECRAGLLASGDLNVSLQIARPEAFGPLTVHPFEQMRDLISYSLSDEHLTLRRELGLPSLDVAPPPPTDDVTAARSRRRLLTSYDQ